MASFIDIDPETMVARLRENSGRGKLGVTMGGMSYASGLREKYSLAHLVYNTIYNLLTQDDQVPCFENAAQHLVADGVLVVKAGAPSAWLRGDQHPTYQRLRQISGADLLAIRRDGLLAEDDDLSLLANGRFVDGSLYA